MITLLIIHFPWDYTLPVLSVMESMHERHLSHSPNTSQYISTKPTSPCSSHPAVASHSVVTSHPVVAHSSRHPIAPTLIIAYVQQQHVVTFLGTHTTSYTSPIIEFTVPSLVSGMWHTLIHLGVSSVRIL